MQLTNQNRAIQYNHPIYGGQEYYPLDGFKKIHIGDIVNVYKGNTIEFYRFKVQDIDYRNKIIYLSTSSGDSVVVQGSIGIERRIEIAVPFNVKSILTYGLSNKIGNRVQFQQKHDTLNSFETQTSQLLSPLKPKEKQKNDSRATNQPFWIGFFGIIKK